MVERQRRRWWPRGTDTEEGDLFDSLIGQSTSHSEPTRAECICGTVRGHRYNRSTINTLFTNTYRI